MCVAGYFTNHILILELKYRFYYADVQPLPTPSGGVFNRQLPPGPPHHYSEHTQTFCQSASQTARLLISRPLNSEVGVITAESRGL